MSRTRFGRLIDRASVAEPDVLMGLACPWCAGGLTVQFVKSSRAEYAGSLFVECTGCVRRIIADGLPAEPPWVAVLGSKVQTKPGAT